MSYIGKIPANAVLTTADLADGIVTAAKIEDGTVVAAELASNAVTTAKINADAVTAAKIADNAVVTAGINADAVTSAKIADDAISEEHLDVTAITGHTAETSVADGDLVVIHDASATALRKMTVANLVANAGGGKILQVVSATKTDTHVESVNSGTFMTNNIASMEPSITCSATSSKVLVMVTMAVSMSATGAISMGLFRGSTQIDLGNASSSRGRTSKGMIYNHEPSYLAMICTNFLDSPSSTSQLTYGVRLGHTSSSAKTIYVNRDHSYTDSAFRFPTSTASITLMEVGA